jgi:high-affinity nickel permease
MYPLGVLFGLGFDTATEIGSLAVAAGIATNQIPFLAILALPLLFAAGMLLMDAADGAFMSQAYGYAIVALFVLTWAASVAIWKGGGIEDRWRGYLQ